MSARLACIVPYCRRTRRPDGCTEWVCAQHWALTDRQLRKAYYRRRRLHRIYGPLGSNVHLERGWRLWERLKRQAIERAGGIS